MSMGGEGGADSTVVSGMAFVRVEEAPKLVLSGTCDRKGSNKIAPFNKSIQFEST